MRDHRAGKQKLLASVPFALLLAALVPTAVAQPPDPIAVFYPFEFCPGGVLEIELWSRERDDWQPHPEHPRVLANRCQIEDAGGLLNETRVRCLSERGRELPWRKVRVWDPAWMESCPAPRSPPTPGPYRIRLNTPRSGDVISTLDRSVEIRGWVELSPRPTSGHDLVLVLDSAASIRGPAQRAVLGLLDELDRHPERSRVGLIHFSSGVAAGTAIGSSPDPPTLQLRDDLAQVRLAVADTAPAPRLGAPEALARAVAALESDAPHQPETGGGEPRRSLVFVVNAGGAYPFGPATGLMPHYRDRLLRLARRASIGGIELTLLALGAVNDHAPELARQMRAEAPGSLQWLNGAPPEPDRLLARRMLPALQQLEVENLDAALLASDIQLEPFNHFRCKLELRDGPNRIAIRARLSPHGYASDQFELLFDASRSKEEWMRVERQRIDRERERLGRKHLVIEVEE